MNEPELSPEAILKTENKHYRVFVRIALFLALLTGAEIIAISLPWNPPLLFSALGILAVIKFICVILWFMHLIFDNPLLTYIFLIGLFIATCLLVALHGLFSPKTSPSALRSHQLSPAPHSLFSPEDVALSLRSHQLSPAPHSLFSPEDVALSISAQAQVLRSIA